MRKTMMAIVLGLAACAPARAATNIYTIANARLPDGRAITGSFGFDTTTSLYSGVAINVAPLPILNLPALDFLDAPLGTATSLTAQLGLNRLSLGFTALPAPGGSVPLTGRLLNVGTLLATPVVSGSISAAVGAGPEPATWGMMVLGFGVAGGALRRSRRCAVRTALAA